MLPPLSGVSPALWRFWTKRTSASIKTTTRYKRCIWCWSSSWSMSKQTSAFSCWNYAKQYSCSPHMYLITIPTWLWQLCKDFHLRSRFSKYFFIWSKIVCIKKIKESKSDPELRLMGGGEEKPTNLHIIYHISYINQYINIDIKVILLPGDAQEYISDIKDTNDHLKQVAHKNRNCYRRLRMELEDLTEQVLHC